MSKYRLFNKWAHDYFINRSIKGKKNTLAIEVGELDLFLKSIDCKTTDFNEIKLGSWSKLLITIGGIPQYFGLLALQSYAAVVMEFDEDLDIRANNYRDRFIALVGIEDSKRLSRFFLESIAFITVQEKIWMSAYEFFKDKSFDIEIPALQPGHRRYIKYPLSQVVLNFEDLKDYVPFFEYLNNKFEMLSFETFIIEYEENISLFVKYLKRKRNKHIDSLSFNENPHFEEIRLKQIFDRYISDAWNDSNPYEKEIKLREGVKYIISFYNELLLFEADVDPISIFESADFLVFEQLYDYPNEYISVDKLNFEMNYLLLIHNTPKNTAVIKESEKYLGKGIIYEKFVNVNIYSFSSSLDLPLFLQKMQSTNKYPFILIGQKIGLKRQYFENTKLEIKLTTPVQYLLFKDGYLCYEFKADIGKYKVLVSGYQNYYFEIIPKPKLFHVVNNSPMLLDLTTLNFSNKTGVSGFLNQGYIKKNEELNIRTWIRTVSKQERLKTNSFLLNVIKQSFHGKDK
nr:hypothetical protein [uncultured Sphingobacterium sp.]